MKNERLAGTSGLDNLESNCRETVKGSWNLCKLSVWFDDFQSGLPSTFVRNALNTAGITTLGLTVSPLARVMLNETKESVGSPKDFTETFASKDPPNSAPLVR